MKKLSNKAPGEKIREARRAYVRGDLEGAVQILLELIEVYSEDLNVRFLLASALFKLRHFAEAVPHLQWMVGVKPLNEWASLGLFHSLWGVGQYDEAATEVKRFFGAGGESMEYRRLVKDMKKAV